MTQRSIVLYGVEFVQHFVTSFNIFHQGSVPRGECIVDIICIVCSIIEVILSMIGKAQFRLNKVAHNRNVLPVGRRGAQQAATSVVGVRIVGAIWAIRLCLLRMHTGANAAVAAVPPVENLGNALGEICQLARMTLLPLLTVVARLAEVTMVAVAIHTLFNPRCAGVAWVRGRRMYRSGRLTPCRILPTIGLGFPKQREGSRERVVPTTGVQRRWSGLGAWRREAFLTLVVVVQKQYVALLK